MPSWVELSPNGELDARHSGDPNGKEVVSTRDVNECEEMHVPLQRISGVALVLCLKLVGLDVEAGSKYRWLHDIDVDDARNVGLLEPGGHQTGWQRMCLLSRVRREVADQLMLVRLGSDGIDTEEFKLVWWEPTRIEPIPTPSER